MHAGYATCPGGIFGVVRETEINKQLQYSMISGATVPNTRMMRVYKRQHANKFWSSAKDS